MYSKFIMYIYFKHNYNTRGQELSLNCIAIGPNDV